MSKRILKACYEGGVKAVEFTARGHFAHLVFTELSKYAKEHLPELALGIGSLTDAASASLYISLGASFVVTPVLRLDIAVVCNRKKILWLPGCGSLTEITKAEEMGCEMIKLFPSDVYGAKFVKGIKGPQPWTAIMPTGGINPTKADLKEWFNAGVSCVGIGSKLISDELIKSGNFNKLRSDCASIIEIIKGIRRSKGC